MSEEVWYQFDGDDDCEDCQGWDGIHNRCDCENRRVFWDCMSSRCKCSNEKKPNCQNAFPSAY
jgi:hypothetical protein